MNLATAVRVNSDSLSRKVNLNISQPPNVDEPPFELWLVAVAEQRDKQAFAGLFRYFAPRIKAIAQGKLGSEAMAQEIVQDTMTNLWRKAHLFDSDKGAATTWIYTVMRNVIFDALRKIKSGSKIALSEDIYPLEAEYEEAEQDNQFSDHLLDEKLAHLVDQLPAAQQQVVRGVYFEELTHEQLAAQLNIPLGTVKSRLRLALGKLKLQIGADHD